MSKLRIESWANEDYATVRDADGGFLGTIRRMDSGHWQASLYSDPANGVMPRRHPSRLTAALAVRVERRERQHTCRWCNQLATTTVGLKNPSAVCSGCARDRTGEITAERVLAAYKRQTDDMVQQDRRVTTALNEASDAITRLQGERDALQAEVDLLKTQVAVGARDARRVRTLRGCFHRATARKRAWIRAAFHGNTLPPVMDGRLIVGSYVDPRSNERHWRWMMGDGDHWCDENGYGWGPETACEWWDPQIVSDALMARHGTVRMGEHAFWHYIDDPGPATPERALRFLQETLGDRLGRPEVALNMSRIGQPTDDPPAKPSPFITADERAERKPLGDMPGSRAVCGWPSYEEDE